MFNEKDKLALSMLKKAKHPSDGHEAWQMLNNEGNLRSVIVTLPDYWKNVYPVGMKNIINQARGRIIPYFESDKIYYFEKKLLEEMSLHGGDYEFEVDYSIMFDTNFASYVDKFVNGHSLNTVERDFVEMLDSIIRYDVRYDYFFYLIENYWFTKMLEEDNLKASNEHKVRQYSNMVSFELFKSIDSEIYKKTGKIVYNMTRNEAIVVTDSLFNTIYSEQSYETMNIFDREHKVTMLFIIGMLKINFRSKETANSKMNEFFDYMNDVIGSYLERESHIAFNYFCNPKSLNILRKINYEMKSDKLRKAISNIAWDFSVPRIMETFISQKWEGRYFIPFFLTFDEALNEVLNMYKIKGIVVDQNTKQMIPFSSDEGVERFINAGVEYDFDKFASQEDFRKRYELYNNNVENGFIIIEKELEELIKILRCT